MLLLKKHWIIKFPVSVARYMLTSGVWVIGGALVLLQPNLVIKQNILSNVSKCMQKQEEEKKNKQTNSNYTHQ